MTQEKRDRDPGPFRLLRRCDEVEPRLGRLFTASAPSRLNRWSGRARQLASSRRVWKVAALAVLMLCMGVWYGRTSGLQDHKQTQRAATTLADGQESHTPVPPYPLPDQPFTNQSVPPCIEKRGEVEIKGGCWIQLAKRPPCFEDQAFYEDKCYLPVAKKKPLPQSFKP